MHADLDRSLTAVIDLVREVHRPIAQAVAQGKPGSEIDCAALSGAVGAMLDAIDARLAPAEPVKAVA